jgi:hypothetical protein
VNLRLVAEHIQHSPDEQLSLLPFASPGNLENHLAQIVTTLQRLAPDLTPLDCKLLLGELALLRMCLDSIERGVRLRVEHAAKRHGFLASQAG